MSLPTSGPSGGGPIMLYINSPVTDGRRTIALPLDRVYAFCAGFLAAIGFTMSSFYSELGFVNELLIDQARVGILIASLLAGIFGDRILNYTLPKVPTGHATHQISLNS